MEKSKFDYLSSIVASGLERTCLHSIKTGNISRPGNLYPLSFFISPWTTWIIMITSQLIIILASIHQNTLSDGKDGSEVVIQHLTYSLTIFKDLTCVCFPRSYFLSCLRSEYPKKSLGDIICFFSYPYFIISHSARVFLFTDHANSTYLFLK